MLRIDEVETPLGPIQLIARGEALCALAFGGPDVSRLRGGPPIRGRIAAAARIRDYFDGDLRALDGLALDPSGTPFQRAVWKLVREIPAGETRTYGELASILKSSPRAVGGANAANPVALVTPCHRVIARGGALCGYAWGEDRKRWLLDHELRCRTLSATASRGATAAP